MRREAQRAKGNLKKKGKKWLTHQDKNDGDYCRRTDDGQISLRFQPSNPVNFDIKITCF